MERGDRSTSKSQRSFIIPKSLLETSWQDWELSLSRRKTRSRPNSTKHLELFNVSSIQCARRLPCCKRCLEDIQGSVGRAGILYQDWFADPSLHNQAWRRISWRRWLRQVNGSHQEKTQSSQSKTSSGARRPHDTYGSSSIFRDPRRILESRKDLSMMVIKKDLWQEALRLKTEQAQQLQWHLAVKSTVQDLWQHTLQKSCAAISRKI